MLALSLAPGVQSSAAAAQAAHGRARRSLAAGVFTAQPAAGVRKEPSAEAAPPPAAQVLTLDASTESGTYNEAIAPSLDGAAGNRSSQRAPFDFFERPVTARAAPETPAWARGMEPAPPPPAQ